MSILGLGPKELADYTLSELRDIEREKAQLRNSKGRAYAADYAYGRIKGLLSQLASEVAALDPAHGLPSVRNED